MVLDLVEMEPRADDHLHDLLAWEALSAVEVRREETRKIPVAMAPFPNPANRILNSRIYGRHMVMTPTTAGHSAAHLAT